MADTSDVKPVRILIVQDDVHFLSGMKEILQLENYSVITATNGIEALQALETHLDVPDLIITNVVMPKMNGLTFIRELHKRPQYKHIPFIVESFSPDYKTEAMELGAAFYIRSPHNVEDLLEAIADALAKA